MARKSYHESELEHVPAVMLGGPIDGKRYRMPVIPGGGVPTAFSTPLQQPHEPSPRAVYLREGDAPVGGYYVYFFDRITDPSGAPALHATPDRHREWTNQG
ncbi:MULTISPECIES: hypothetical protein [unclassified Microbacterium]|uniref:hypothetical protein n=1 Tax=unclassified Microbacterium TaxID=2609290 RepID=UPI00214D098F|nr:MULTISPECIES: hypothetical protein [unclassified Microbacterium]MCR2784137.1 hypothetical protein [Microbacterium sp. zg.B96]WIM15027.1 hypothetical protein QNO11_10750 [Microbacterium sp. zg-B96]